MSEVSKIRYVFSDRLFWMLLAVIGAAAPLFLQSDAYWFVVIGLAKEGFFIDAAQLSAILFLLMPFGLPFAVPYALALSMPGLTSLFPVAVAAVVAASLWFYYLVSGDLEYGIFSVRDAYAMHRLLLPKMLGLAAGVLMRGVQLRHGYPCLRRTSIGLLIAGMMVPQAQVISALGPGG
jgi:hypothetical protein